MTSQNLARLFAFGLLAFNRLQNSFPALLTACILISGQNALAATDTPFFNIGTGTYHAPIKIFISDNTAGSVIYYTTNGTTPTAASTVYTSPFAISSTSTVEAIAASAGISSAVASAIYSITPALTPSFSAGTGTYHAPQTVVISDATSGAVIHYTTNGTTPTTASPFYTAPITISSTTTLQAIAIYPGGQPSAPASATYTISISPAVTPTFSTGTGTYHAPQTVVISDGTSGAVIYYTTNGSTPTTASTVYTAPISIATTTTLEAMAVHPGAQSSAVASETIAIAPAMTPSFSTGTGTYHAPPSVSIVDGTSGAVIYYTTNGSTPTKASTVYSGPIPIPSTTTLQAIAIYPGGPPSAVSSATYTIVPALNPVLSLASGTYEKSVSVTISDGTPGAVIYYTTNGATPTAASAVYSGAITFGNTTTFSTTQTLEAVAVYPGGPPSAVTSATYSILSASTPIHAANSGSSFFGMNVVGLLDGTPWPVVPVSTVRLMGVETAWSTMNPTSGTYQWSSLDAMISLAQANNSKVLFTFIDTPSWAIPTVVPISSVSRSGGIVTVTTAQPHSLYYNPTDLPTEQSSITISGVTDTSFDGTFTLTGTPTPASLTFAQAGSNGASVSGTVSAVCSGINAPGGCVQAPQDISSWDQFVTELVNHVGPGSIQYWELWNEANTSATWQGDPKMLVAMAADAKAIIKAVDPNAIILSPSTTVNFETPEECATYDLRCGSTWLNNWLAAGGQHSIDGVAFHGYPQITETPEQIQGAITLLQIAMNQNGVGALPLIDTESSWGLNTALPEQTDQVAFLARHLLLEQSMGVQGSFWYNYSSPTWGTLWSASTGLNPVGDADQQVAKWIEGATLTQPCAATTADPTTFTCGYTRPNGYSALAVWNTVGEKSFAVPQNLVQYHDLGGSTVPVSGGSVEISTAPILLETSSAF